MYMAYMLGRTVTAVYSVMSKFHYIYLAQNLLKTRSPTSFEQKKSRKPGLRQDRSISTCRDRSSGKFSTNKKSRGPGRRQVGDKFSTKKVGDLVSDFFSTKKSETWSPTCLRPGLRQVRDKSYDKSYDKIDLMEFGL